GCDGRLDPADDDAIVAERLRLRRQGWQPTVERCQRHVAAARRQAELVEPTAHLLRRVPVQVEELDALVADRRHSSERPFEVASAILADRVQHQADSRHPPAPFRWSLISPWYHW